MNRLRQIAIATLVFGALWVPSSAAAYHTRHCKALGYCELELPASQGWRNWHSPFRLRDESELGFNVYLSELEILARRNKGCRAWYSSRGLNLRVSACHRGWSRVELHYRSPTPVFIQIWL